MGRNHPSDGDGPIVREKRLLSKPAIVMIALIVMISVFVLTTGKESPPPLGEAVSQEIETTLRDYEIFRLLFNDFPDRHRILFIKGFRRAFEPTYDEATFKSALWESYHLMALHHVHHYAASTSDAAMLEFMQADYDRLKGIYEKNPDKCREYYHYTGHFHHVRRLIGDSKYIRYAESIPKLILASLYTPQAKPGKESLLRAKKALHQRTQAFISQLPTDTGERHYCQKMLDMYEVLFSLPPEDASLLYRDRLSRKHDVMSELLSIASELYDAWQEQQRNEGKRGAIGL